MPKVSIIITTYLAKTYPYLKLCIESVKNLNYSKDDLEIILVCHKRDSEKYSSEFVPQGVRVIAPGMENFSNAEGLNIGVSHASPESKYYFLLNDDVILSKHSLFNLVQSVDDQQIIASPISQCDNGRYFKLHMGASSTNGNFIPFLKQAYRLEEVEHFTKEIMNTASVYPPGIIYADFLCFFAVFIPASIWKKVGKLEEGFQQAGPDDLDYSVRCHQNGIRSAFVLDSFVFHFSGTSADSSISIANRIYNARYFKKKWGFNQPGLTDEMLEQWEKSV